VRGLRGKAVALLGSLVVLGAISVAALKARGRSMASGQGPQHEESSLETQTRVVPELVDVDLTLLDSNGAPVTACCALAASGEPAEIVTLFTTDGNGRWSGRRAPGRYTLFACATSSDRVLILRGTLSLMKSESYEARFRKGATLHCRIVDENGNPLPSSLIAIRYRIAKELGGRDEQILARVRQGHLQIQASADENGEVVFSNVSNEITLLPVLGMARRDRAYYWSLITDLPVRSESQIETSYGAPRATDYQLCFRRLDSPVVAFRVQSLSGEPVAGAQILLVARTSEGGGMGESSGRTSADGRVSVACKRFLGQQPSSYVGQPFWACIGHSEFATRYVVGKVGSECTEVVLEERPSNAAVWGYVRSKSGQPLHGCRVRMEGPFPKVWVTAEVGHDGSFTIRGVERPPASWPSPTILSYKIVVLSADNEELPILRPVRGLTLEPEIGKEIEIVIDRP